MTPNSTPVAALAARVSALLAIALTTLLLPACGAPRVSADEGARVRRVTTTLDENLVRIAVLVETLADERQGRDRKTRLAPEPGVTVTLTGPAGTELSEKTETGQDGLARFDLATSLTRLYALQPGAYRISVQDATQAESIDISASELNALIIAGEQRLIEATGPSVANPRGLVDAKFHPVGEPRNDREFFINPPEGGDTIELSVIARNVGDGALYQLVGTVEAKGPAARLRRPNRPLTDTAADDVWFPPVELEFGKLEPGESTSLVLPIAIPRAVQGGPLDVVITWSELNGNTPPDLDVQLPPLAELEPPSVAVDYSLSTDGAEASTGGGFPVGQNIEITVSVTPFGGAEPRELILAVDTETPDAIELITAQTSKTPAPGTSPIEVGPVVVRLTSADQTGQIRVRLEDADFGELWAEFIPIEGAQGGP